MPCAGKILILGYGNPLRSDDGFGWQAAQRLAALVGDPDVDVRALHQLTPELAEPLSQSVYAIFIDAGREGVPGELRRQRVQPAPAGAFTHHITPDALLALARGLYGRAPALGELCGLVLSLLQEL